MHKRRTIYYILADGQKVTCRQVADEIGISVKAGGKPRGKQKKPKVVLPYEDEMWKLVMKII